MLILRNLPFSTVNPIYPYASTREVDQRREERKEDWGRRRVCVRRMHVKRSVDEFISKSAADELRQFACEPTSRMTRRTSRRWNSPISEYLPGMGSSRLFHVEPFLPLVPVRLQLFTKALEHLRRRLLEAPALANISAPSTHSAGPWTLDRQWLARTTSISPAISPLPQQHLQHGLQVSLSPKSPCECN